MITIEEIDMSCISLEFYDEIKLEFRKIINTLLYKYNSTLFNEHRTNDRQYIISRCNTMLTIMVNDAVDSFYKQKPHLTRNFLQLTTEITNYNTPQTFLITILTTTTDIESLNMIQYYVRDDNRKLADLTLNEISL